MPGVVRGTEEGRAGCKGVARCEGGQSFCPLCNWAGAETGAGGYRVNEGLREAFLAQILAFTHLSKVKEF